MLCVFQKSFLPRSPRFKGDPTNSRALTVLRQDTSRMTPPRKMTGCKWGGGEARPCHTGEGHQASHPPAKSLLKVAAWGPTALEPTGGAGKGARGGRGRGACNVPAGQRCQQKWEPRDTGVCRPSWMSPNAPARDRVQKGRVSPHGAQSKASAGPTSRWPAERMAGAAGARGGAWV